MSRRTLIAGNWKLNLAPAAGADLVNGIRAGLSGNEAAEILVCPTFLSFDAARNAAAGSAVQVGGQNCFWEKSGAYTGEVSAAMLKEAGATHVILGHSERRQYFGETDETINTRTKAALEAGLVPVLCIGETLEEREAGKLEDVLKGQLTGSLAGLNADDLKDLVVAYEPVWAIGTGVTASTEQAQEAHVAVRGFLKELVGDLADSVRILYGGSVKPGNAGELLGQADIDGALVGGASLKAEDFLGIISAAG
jgi:triosephosphate isomerase